MHVGDKFGTTAIALVVFQEEFTCFLVQSRFRVGINQKAFDGNQYMANAV